MLEETLNSINENLQDLTGAVLALTAALSKPEQDAAPEPAVAVTPAVPVALPVAASGTSPKAVTPYKIEELQRAMVPLCDQGKLGEIQGIIKGLGYSSLMDVPAEQYGAVADGLRGLGAQI